MPNIVLLRPIGSVAPLKSPCDRKVAYTEGFTCNVQHQEVKAGGMYRMSLCRSAISPQVIPSHSAENMLSWFPANVSIMWSTSIVVSSFQ